ncbi:hypothetical protein EBF13_18160, partial [Shigella flexneri]|nr:hypothetical protein [Shigella flexneri]
RFSGPKTSIICSPMTSLKTSIKTITYLSDTGCLEIQGASLAVDGVSAALAMRGRAAATATTRRLGENENSMQNAPVSCHQNDDVIKH